MKSITLGLHPVPGKFCLVLRHNRTFVCWAFDTHAELCMAAYAQTPCLATNPSSDARAVRAHAPSGGILAFDETLACGRRLERARMRRRFGRGRAHFYRQGPVAGIHRSGGYRCYRKMHTTPARRQACLVLVEEGEVAVRAARNMTNLPSSWDDYWRHIERCWKGQHKGRKAWDR